MPRPTQFEKSISFLAKVEDVEKLDRFIEKGLFANRSEAMRELLSIFTTALEASLQGDDVDKAVDEALEKIRPMLKLWAMKARLSKV